MNKREFVLASGGALVAGGSWSAGLPGPSTFQTHAASDGSLGYWRGREGERFDVFGAGLSSHLVLQRVDEHLRDPRTSQFSLLFESAGVPPTAGVLVLRPASGGALALCLEQAGADSRGAALLRADFCQLA